MVTATRKRVYEIDSTPLDCSAQRPRKQCKSERQEPKNCGENVSDPNATPCKGKQIKESSRKYTSKIRTRKRSSKDHEGKQSSQIQEGKRARGSQNIRTPLSSNVSTGPPSKARSPASPLNNEAESFPTPSSVGDESSKQKIQMEAVNASKQATQSECSIGLRNGTLSENITQPKANTQAGSVVQTEDSAPIGENTHGEISAQMKGKAKSKKSAELELDARPEQSAQFSGSEQSDEDLENYHSEPDSDCTSVSAFSNLLPKWPGPGISPPTDQITTLWEFDRHIIDEDFGKKVRDQFRHNQLQNTWRTWKYPKHVTQRYKRNNTPEKYRAQYREHVKKVRAEMEQLSNSE